MATRRDVLKSAAALGITALPAFSAPGNAKSVIVAGAGIGGLCCAYELTRRGHAVTVLEASGRVGGHVRTVRDDLPDGLYVDAGAEQFTKPGYDQYWSYVREFELPHVQDHRRDRMVRCIGDSAYSEEQLADPKTLSGFGFKQREIDFLRQHPWPDLPRLYFDRYTERIQDEYQPFNSGLNELDTLTVSQLLERDGASPACIRFAGGRNSALHTVFHLAILRLRGVPAWPTQVFRLIGGNSTLPETFARKLGKSVRLGCPVTAIQHGPSGVTVEFQEFGKPLKISADYLVCCMSAVVLRTIPVTPALSDRKRWAIDNVPYYSAARPVFRSRTRFWREQSQSINIEFNDASLEHVWSMADEVQTSYGLITGTASPGVSAEKALGAFRAHYPGGADTVEQAMIIDWSKERWTSACETTTYRPGDLKKFWPTLLESEGRIHFAGAYCDNLNWGQEAATRSANRVALAIHAA